MRYITLMIILSFTLFNCQKKESVLETERNALNSVFNEVVDSVFLKSTENKSITKQNKKKTLVIYDSLMTIKPNYAESSRKSKTKIYSDSTSEKIRPKIELPLLEKKANFKYRYSLSLTKDTFPSNFWNSNYALPGILLFSKITFDEERKLGAFYCTFSNGNIYKEKNFLIYIKKKNSEWKLTEVNEERRTY